LAQESGGAYNDWPADEGEHEACHKKFQEECTRKYDHLTADRLLVIFVHIQVTVAEGNEAVPKATGENKHRLTSKKRTRAVSAAVSAHRFGVGMGTRFFKKKGAYLDKCQHPFPQFPPCTNSGVSGCSFCANSIFVWVLT